MTQITAPTLATPVPIGTDVTVGPLTLRVEEAITAEGTATVANTNGQNDAPPSGLQYVLARVTVTNAGQQVQVISASDFPVASTDGVLRRCPSIALPDPPLDVALAPGETFTGWTGGLANDVANVVMLFDPAMPVGTRYAAAFALTDGATLPTYEQPPTEPSDVGASLEAPAGVGETVRTAIWEVTVNNSIDSDSYYEASDYRVRALGAPVPGDPESWQAIGLDVTIRNISPTPQFFSWTALELIDTNGEPWDHLLAMTQPHPPISIELLPGATANGWYGIWLQPWATTSLLRLRDSKLTEEFRYISLDGTAGATAQTPTEPEPDDGTPSEPLNLGPGDGAQVGADPVNLRSEPSTSGQIVSELPPGTQITVSGDAVEGDGYRWYPVEVADTGQSGFVVEDYIEPAGD